MIIKHKGCRTNIESVCWSYTILGIVEIAPEIEMICSPIHRWKWNASHL